MKHAILNRDLGQVRTIIVLGVGRGGTSVVAGTLRALGVSMGTSPHPLKHEWTPVVYAADGKLDVRASYLHALAMDHAHEVWGWKSPRDVFQLESLLPLLRDPGFVFVTRDLLETSLSGETYQNVPLYISLDETALVYRAITTRLRFWPWPALILPFAGALAEPESLIEILCTFAGLKPTAENRERALHFVRPGHNAYRPFDAKPDDPPHLTSADDLRADSEGLAADLSNRYGKEYTRQVHAALNETKTLATTLLPQLKNGDIDGAALIGRLRHWSDALSEDSPRENGTDLPPGANAREVSAALEKAVSGLARELGRANEELARRKPHSGYVGLDRLYRILQVAVRIRGEVQRSATLTGLCVPAK